MILRDADSPVCEDRAGFTTQRNRNVGKFCSIHHLELMLRLVSPFKGNPKGWHSYRGVDRSYPGGLNVGGDVCSAKE